MQDGIVMQLGEKWPEMSSDIVRPARNPDGSKKTEDKNNRGKMGKQ